MILETRHLRLVAAVAEHGTLTKAGRVLHLTQSGLSRQLLDLETKLGLPLFHRLGKRMVPTPAGERLVVAARRALPQLTDVEDELRRLAGCRACCRGLPEASPGWTCRSSRRSRTTPCRRCSTAASISPSCPTTITTTGSRTSPSLPTSWSRYSAPTIRSAPSRSSRPPTSRISTCSCTCCRRARTTSSRSC